MVRSSGIGSYIRAAVPGVLAGSKAGEVTVLGPVDDLASAGFDTLAGTSLQDCRSPIYSLREQVELRQRTPPLTELFWSPHYNIPLLHRGKLLVTVHDVLHLARPEYVKGWHRRSYARVMFRAVHARASRIICDSTFTADELVRLTPIVRSRIDVVQLGVGADWFQPAGAARRDRPYFLFLGNVKPHKNLVTLMSAFEIVAREEPHDLLIVGRNEGLIGGDPHALVAAKRVGSRAIFTGQLDDDQVRAHVANAEALVLPSLYEGFGLPALEAMAAGTPVLASRTASLPEVCGDAALYFDPTDPAEMARLMRRVIGDAGLRRELVEAGRARAREFTWDRCIRQTTDILDRVLAT
jgi:glycosyltransferase involved in cell wall biosynthesis